MNRLKLIIFFVIPLLLTFSCRESNKYLSDNEVRKYKKPLQKVNKYLVEKDAEIIESYAKRRKWDMKTTESGLWYMIYKNGAGKQAKEGMIARINYNVSLLDGSFCYSTDSLGPENFRIGHSTAEQGLQEGILLMRTGDKARFILPPHLAHGLLGDSDKIPARATIIYDVELLDLN